jgi:uncharacterized protein YsxB (DUF464 family)
MTRITYSPQNLTIAIRGHAEYAEAGKDIVCASVSILGMTIAQFAGKLKDEGLANPEIIVEKGDLYIDINPNTYTDYEDVLWVVDNICAGFELLAQQYPNNVEYINLDDFI